MWATLTDILVVFLIQTLHFSVVNAAVSYFSCDQEGDKRCCQNNRDGVMTGCSSNAAAAAW